MRVHVTASPSADVDTAPGGAEGSTDAVTPARRRRRRPPLVPALLALLVAAVVTVGVVTAVQRGRAGGKSPAPASSASQSRTLLDVATNLDQAVAATVGAGGMDSSLKLITGAPALTDAKGHPAVFFVAAEGCGACAAQRWSLLLALGRFGTFHNVFLGQSSATDAHPNLATFSLRGVQYSSQYLSLVAAEIADADGKPLETLGSEGQSLLGRYDAPPYVPASAAGALPWLDIANTYAVAGSGYPPDTLKGLPWGQIAQQLGNANSAVTRAIVGNANWITAGVCRVTGLRPANVCSTAPIAGLVKQLP